MSGKVFLIAICLFSTICSFAQPKANEINLLDGVIQENGLPEGWIMAGDNYECTIKFTESKAIYFERRIKDEKCSFAFYKEMPEGEYVLKTDFTIDGNGYEIFLDGVPLGKEHKIKTENGKIRVGIQTKGDGKVWGWISKMTLTKSGDTTMSANFKTNDLTTSTIEKIKQIVTNCQCAKYVWKNRGKSPIGYMKGVALTYAKSYYELKVSPSKAVKIMSQNIGETNKDALAHYGFAGNSDVERLRKTYALALGLGMRESSGNTTEGRDESVPITNVTEINAEAGLFQVSYDSFGVSKEFPTLFNRYKNNPNQCSLSVFKEGVKDRNKPLVGNGKGAEFQKFTKECPAFATEYVMIMLRQNRRHFGPINRKEAEYRADVENMLKSIEKIVDSTID